MPDASDLMAFAALILSGVAVWARIRVPKRQRELALLQGYHRRIEKIAREVEDQLFWELVGEIPATWEQHTGDFTSQVLRKYLEGRRTYERVKAYLPPESRALVDESLCEYEALRTSRVSGRGVKMLTLQERFLNDLARVLDVAAHPGMKLVDPSD